MTAPLRGAILGFGHVAEHGHLPGWQAQSGLRIVAVAEPNERRRARARELLPEIIICADARDLLGRTSLDFVDIAAPPTLHTPLVEAAAAAGLHIVCEKPLAVSAADYNRLRKAVLRAGVTLFTVHNWKYSEPFQRVNALLAEGAIGRLTEIRFETTRDGCARSAGSDWRTNSALAGGGILVDHGWHAFYLMLALANERPLAVRAKLERRRYVAADVEDTAACTIDFPTLRAQLDLTWAGTERRTTWHLQGERGSIDVVDDRISLDRAAGSQRFTCAQSLSEGSHHPEWFGAVIEAFEREIVDPRSRGENLAEAEQCVQLLAGAYASHAAASRAQPLSAPSAARPARLV